ncbi:hypothetical protein KO561_03715 [Radiobacillus kanasensis]|uniref:hypothetical protein n=1 Tax=Radiobacillus kanasensis TaxID=2844358 RepID=UPI001E60441C|nr:hypothetical protein [Radiobacillus kanasensis]UFU00083.1 hypothetical protein KO561_03715 [Radiobacillus kanasensis]
MKLFFKDMSRKESENWNKSAILGFYVYMFLLFLDLTSLLFLERHIFSTILIFWTGLVVAYGCNFILNLKTKKK